MENLKSAKTWTTEQLDQAIKHLSDLRASKQPPIETTFQPGKPVPDVTVNPRWNTQREALEGKSLLHFRHPGLGWLHFAIPANEAKQLAGHLLEQVRITEQQASEKPKQ